MMFDDTYKMLSAPGEGLYKEKGSKFIASAFTVMNEDEVKRALAEVKKTYYDARHHCYAYIIGHDKACFRSSDDGEPSGTAGKPLNFMVNLPLLKMPLQFRLPAANQSEVKSLSRV